MLDDEDVDLVVSADDEDEVVAEIFNEEFW